jgi:LysR family transcriptional regulator, hydrogen peroxide-inducible genes activator
MNLRDLKYLVAVADHGHFGRAAKACHASQPTLSGQIRKLEAYLGAEIFERTKRSVRLTPVGQEIVTRARTAVREAEAIRALAQARQDPFGGDLSLGVIPTVGPYLLPMVLRPLAQAHERLSLILIEETTTALVGRLLAGDLDAAILATDHTAEGLHEIPLYDEPFWLAYPRGHALHGVKRVTAALLTKDRPLLLSDGHCLRDQALELCGRAPDTGVAADLRASSLETLVNLVGAGYGITLVPALAIRGGWTTDLGVQVRQIDVPRARRRVRLVHRRSFPRKRVLDSMAKVIRGHLPNTVRACES